MFDDDTLLRLTLIPGKEGELLCPQLVDLEAKSLELMTPGLFGAMIVSRCLLRDAPVNLKRVHITTVNGKLHPVDRMLLGKVDRKVSTVCAFTCQEEFDDEHAFDESDWLDEWLD
ncbi:hypothetical protein AMATHDRAFT_50668 [Amanita thiersii Skay4041]|uniref:Uncharacterized protein n=1 Tax=Amanita thiersii Skay4041 TaxID=703135 RepID=A0A2A9NA32_9AGAR|nr:hypothetical protein AMATHDRAFT_50668 [Amanita thiersii Skay4041]